jgi:hypothetical protein
MMSKGLKWRDVPGTTLAVTGLVVLGAAAIVSAPFWMWHRRKRRRTDEMVKTVSAPQATSAEPRAPTS